MKISASYWMFEGGLEGKRPIVEAMKEAKKLMLSSQRVNLPYTPTLSSKKVLSNNSKEPPVETGSIEIGTHKAVFLSKA
jgi:hypothetical protein